jgi:hypothetical protein
MTKELFTNQLYLANGGPPSAAATEQAAAHKRGFLQRLLKRGGD